MESDDDYESFSFPNDEPSPSPSPSPKHRRLKRLKKSTVVADQSAPVESVTELLDLPRVDFARLEALESSDIRAFDDSSEPQSSPLSDGFDGHGNGKQSSSGFDDTIVDGDPKETTKASEFEEAFGDDGKEKELGSCFDDTRVNNDRKVRKRDLEFEEGLNDDDDEMENKSGSGCGDTPVRTDRKETKRVLEFEDEINGSGVDQMGGKERETLHMKPREDGEKEVDEGAMNEKKGKKKRLKSSSEDPKAKASSSNKRREEKERKAHLEQLHAESQRLLRETRGAAFKPIPLVQKPISSILERIRQRKLELAKKFCQPSNSESVKEYDGCLKEAAIDHSKSVETEVADLSESVKEEKVSSVLNGEPTPDDICVDGPDVCGEQKSCDNASSQMALDEESTPVFRPPANDTEELFGDSQTEDSKESKDEEACEQTISSQEEEMGPSWLTMKLKLDSAPDDISDEEENDKENIEPHIREHPKERSSPKGDPVKAFVDDEAEEEDDSDNDRMRFGDDEEDEDDADAEELRKMIAIGYVEKPIDKEARNELHQKWLEEKDAAGTDDLLRRLNVTSKLREASLLDEEEGEEDVEEPVDDVYEEDVERPKVAKMNSKKAKEIIAQMFTDKDEDFLSSDDEETEKLLAKRCLFNKAEEKGKLVSPIEDEGSKEVFGLIKKLNIVPEARKKAKPTSFFDTMLTGGNSNSSSKSSFLSRVSNHSVPISSKQGSTAVRSFIFGRDDSNSRSSISISEETSSDTTSREVEKKKITTTNNYRSSQSQARASGQTTKVVGESSSSLFEILKRSSSVRLNDENNVVDLSQSVFAAFKIPKKPVKIQRRV